MERCRPRVFALPLIFWVLSSVSRAEGAPIDLAQSALNWIDDNSDILLASSGDNATINELRLIKSSTRAIKEQIPKSLSSEYATSLVDDGAAMNQATDADSATKRYLVDHVASDLQSKVDFIKDQEGAASSWIDSIRITANVRKGNVLLHGLRLVCNTWRHRDELATNPQFIFATPVSGATRSLPIGEVTCAAFATDHAAIVTSDFQIGKDGTPTGEIDLLAPN